MVVAGTTWCVNAMSQRFVRWATLNNDMVCICIGGRIHFNVVSFEVAAGVDNTIPSLIAHGMVPTHRWSDSPTKFCDRTSSLTQQDEVEVLSFVFKCYICANLLQIG